MCMCNESTIFVHKHCYACVCTHSDNVAMRHMYTYANMHNAHPCIFTYSAACTSLNIFISRALKLLQIKHALFLSYSFENHEQSTWN